MDSKNELIPQNAGEAVIDADKSVELYEQIADEFSYGPQQEGLITDDLRMTVTDRAGYFVAIDQDKPEESIPLATPLSHVSTVNTEYFKDKFGDGFGDDVFFVSPHVARYLIASDRGQDLISAAQEITSSGKTLFISDQEDIEGGHQGITDYLKHELGDDVEELPVLDKKHGTAASVIHYSGVPKFDESIELGNEHAPSFQEMYRTKVGQGDADPIPETGTVILLPEHVTEELLEDIWTMYDAQMDVLIEDHPMFQRLDKKELFGMLLSDNGANVVHFEGAKPVCLFVGITSLETEAPWLRTDYINQRYGYAEEILYCPAMAADMQRQGMNYSKHIFGLLARLVQERGKNVRPYFECTNISAQYVPKHVFEPAINETGICSVEVDEQARYSYDLIVSSK